MNNPYEKEKSESVDSHHQVMSELGEAREAQLGEETILEPDIEQDIQTLKQELTAAEEKAEQYLDQLKRSEAARQNDRHHAERELAKAHKFALEKFVADLLSVADSLERGLTEIAANNGSLESLQQGSELTLNMLVKALNKHKVTQIDPLGEAFNPELHEAMSIVSIPDAKPNTVHQVLQKGYLLHDRLVRPAMVIVTKA